MTTICSAKQARDFDQRTIEHYQIPSLVLMEHAAIECARFIEAKHPKQILVVCGSGNNGGDGLAIARLLIQAHIPVDIYLVGTHFSDANLHQQNILKKMGVSVQTDWTMMKDNIYTYIIDCIFGNGLSREIKEPYYSLIADINKNGSPTISIDVPSGLDATSGEILGIAIHADITLSLDCIKWGQITNQGPSICGQLHCFEIGIIHDAPTMQLIDKTTIHLPERSNLAHKGTFGKALMIGGSHAMHGAITMAAKACYKSGIGTLTLMLPNSIADILAYKMDSAMRLIYPQENFDSRSPLFLQTNMEKFDLLSIGNGMGQVPSTIEMVHTALASTKPVLVDADGLWALQEHPEWLHRQAPTIITPHVKEFSYLTHQDVSTIAKHPLASIQPFVEAYPEVTLVLKSNVTVVAQGTSQYVLYAPNSALSKGGSGDILCGIITGLYGQCKNVLQSAITGVYIHSQCAKVDMDSACVQPDDIIDQLPTVFRQLRKKG